MINFRCPKCNDMLSVPESVAGEKENCPCGNICIVPSNVKDVSIICPNPNCGFKGEGLDRTPGSNRSLGLVLVLVGAAILLMCTGNVVKNSLAEEEETRHQTEMLKISQTYDLNSTQDEKQLEQLEQMKQLEQSGSISGFSILLGVIGLAVVFVGFALRRLRPRLFCPQCGSFARRMIGKYK